MNERLVLRSGVGAEIWRYRWEDRHRVDHGEGRPVIHLLGPVEAAGFGGSPALAASGEGLPPLTSQQVSLLAFLAVAGPVSAPEVVEAIWSGRPVSAGRFSNLVAELRSRIGDRHLPRAEAGRYRLSGVATDVELFAAVTGSGIERRPTAELMALVELITGMPLTAPGRRHWGWADHHPYRCALETLVVDGVSRIVDVCLERGEWEGAVYACQRALLAVPYDEPLVVRLVKILIGSGRWGTAVRQVESWEARIRQLGCGEPSRQPRLALAGGQASTGSAVTTTLSR